MNSIFNSQFYGNNKQITEARRVKFGMETDHNCIYKLCVNYCLQVKIIQTWRRCETFRLVRQI